MSTRLTCALFLTGALLLSSQFTSAHHFHPRHPNNPTEKLDRRRLPPPPPQRRLGPQRQMVQDAYDEALAIVDQASRNGNQAQRMRYGKLRARLRVAQIRTPESNRGRNFKRCSQTRFAWAEIGGRQITLCRELFDQRLGTTAIAQILIHEASHLMGVQGECEATRLEVEIMRVSGWGVRIRNEYWDQCGIE